ncbi:Gp37-like protein [Piscibacillus sp. B03]|uniref:Gp37-like protein n=1 Tax=Piscibacillus sp. B03 TaxID=3457430 RepID=UPI003FCCDB57
MTQPVRVYDQQLNLLYETDNYLSLIFNPKFYEIGSFEFHINQYVEGADYFQKGHLIVLDKRPDKAMLIRHREIALDQNGKVTENWKITGVTLEGVLDQRITIPPSNTDYDRISGPAETVMKHYVRNHLVDPANPNRKIDFVEVAADQKRGEHVEWESRLKNVADEISDIAKQGNLGFVMYADMERGKWIFDVVEPRDVTRDNPDFPPVFFSPDFATIKTQQFVDSHQHYKNVGYVGGQGEGKDRTIVQVGDHLKGIERAEIFIDARDVGMDENDEGNEDVPEDEIEDQLKERGRSKLREHETTFFLEAQILTPVHNNRHNEFAMSTPFEYEVDFRLGDVVEVFNKKWNITMNAPITEIREIHEANGFTLEATFGEAQPTLMKKLNDRFNELMGIEQQELPVKLSTERMQQAIDYAESRVSQEEQERIQQAQENLEASKEYADEESYQAMVNANEYTESYAEKKKISQDVEPLDPEVIWIDTSQTPNVPKVHNGFDWEKISPTEAAEVGAETPEGAQDKSNQAENNAKSHADTVASEAQSNAESYADTVSEQALIDAQNYAVAKEVYNNEMQQIANDLADKAGIEYVDGQLVDKANKADVYTIEEVDDRLLNYVSVTEYETDMNGVVQELDSHSTTLGQHETAIGLKADSTRVDNLEGTIEDHSTQLNIMADQISSKVDATYVDGVIADIEVGGRNYVSRKDYTQRGNSDYHDIIVDDTQTHETGEDVYKVTKIQSGTPPIRIHRFPNGIKEGEVWTASIYVKLDENNDMTNDSGSRLILYDGTDRITLKSSGSFAGLGEWKRLTFTFKNETGQDIVNDLWVYFYDCKESGNITYFSAPQVEKGNKATDWTPAPEDVQDQIDDLDVTVSNHSSSITQLSTEIESKVESSVFDVLEGRVTDAESTITQHSNEIALKADSTVVDEIESRVSTAEVDINALESEIVLKADSTVVDGLETRITSAESDIDGLNSTISLKADSTVVDGIEERVTTAELNIDGLEGEIDLRVEKDGVISAINLSSESTTIQSSKINLVGAVTVLSDITDDLGDIYAGNIYGAYIEGGEIVQNAGSGHTSIHLNDKGLIVRDGEGDDRLAIVTDEYEFQGANPSTIYFEPNTSEEFILGTFHEGLGEAFLGFVDQQPDYYFNIRNWGGTIGLDARTTSVTKQSGWEEHFLLRRYDTYNAVWDMNLANGNLNFEYRGEYGGSRDRYFTISKTGNVYVGQGIGHVVAGYIDFTQSGNSAGYLGVSSRLRVTDGDFWQGSNTTVYQPVNASSFNESSLEELKQDIELLTINALEIIVDADLYSFKRIDEVERGMNYTRYGFVIGEDKKTPVEVLDDEGEAINHGNISAILWKGQQEIITHIYNHDERINDLEIENQLLKERVRQLEEAS